LKGGKESVHTASLLVKIISEALETTDIPRESIAYLTSREQVTALLSMTESIDLVIPRGSNALVSSIQNSTRIPVMGHADGRCCAYVHSDADVTMARDVVTDSKVDYPAACNALETLLVHEDLVRDGRIKEIVSGLVEKGVELRCEEDILRAFGGAKGAIKATEEDITTEFLDLRIYIRSVISLDQGNLLYHRLFSNNPYKHLLLAPHRHNLNYFTLNRRTISTSCRFGGSLLECINEVPSPTPPLNADSRMVFGTGLVRR
jgi:glutamate-5-semialdehyde dehydrogenase